MVLMVFKDSKTDFVDSVPPSSLIIYHRLIDCNSMVFIENVTQKIKLKKLPKKLYFFLAMWACNQVEKLKSSKIHLELLFNLHTEFQPSSLKMKINI